MRSSSCKSCGDEPAADVCELLRERLDGVLSVESLPLLVDVPDGVRRLFEPDEDVFLVALTDNFGCTAALSGLDSPPVVDVVDDVLAASASSELLSESMRAFSAIDFSPPRRTAVRFLPLPPRCLLVDAVAVWPLWVVAGGVRRPPRVFILCRHDSKSARVGSGSRKITGCVGNPDEIGTKPGAMALCWSCFVCPTQDISGWAALVQCWQI